MNFLIPGVYHELIFSKLYAGTLRRLDICIRGFARQTLHLPHDLPVAAFHAKPAVGGPVIPCLRWIAPLRQQLRVPYIANPGLLKYNNITFRAVASIYTYFKNRLHQPCDGKGLRQHHPVPAASLWILDGSALLSGRDFISAIHVRYTLYSIARSTRGRNFEHQNRMGCNYSKTLNHMIQVCYGTHGLRIKRHNTIASYIKRSAEQRGWTAHEEPIFKIQGARDLKPGSKRSVPTN